MTENIIQLSDHRPHDAQYVACMNCAHDWVAVFPINTPALQCPKCGEMQGEEVNTSDPVWFNRFMSGKDRHRRTLVMINAGRQGK